jgi:hypothetical protein
MINALACPLVRRSLSAAMLLSLLLQGTLAAAEVAYPKENAQFTIQVPDGLKPIYRDDSLVLLPTPEDGFVIQVNEQPAAASKVLGALTERVATQMKLTDLVLGTASDAENQQEVECTVMTSTGRADGVPIVITIVAFSIEDEKHFTIQSVGTAELNKKHSGELLDIVDSIKPD